MLQIRLKEGNKQWFNPARDLVNVTPGLVRAALTSFDDFQGNDKCSREEMLAAASGLALIFKAVIEQPVDPVDVNEKYDELAAKFPAAMNMIGGKFMRVLTVMFAAWVIDAKPKTDGDAEITKVSMDAIIEYLTSEHEYGACECGSTRFILNTRPKGLLLCDGCGKPVQRVKK